MNSDEIKDWLLEFIKVLVDYPEEVVVAKTTDEQGVLYTLKLNQKDAGKIIGKRGATAKSIRTILRVVGMKNEIRATLRIDVPQLTPKV